jgi:hypothetical protein
VPYEHFRARLLRARQFVCRSDEARSHEIRSLKEVLSTDGAIRQEDRRYGGLEDSGGGSGRSGIRGSKKACMLLVFAPRLDQGPENIRELAWRSD